MKHFISICMCVMLMFGVVGSVPPVSAEMFFADGYNGSTYVGSSTETIDYNTKSDTKISINGGLPKYYDVSVKKNTCANVAGSILLGYYDKDFDELIPDFKSARVIRDKILYSAQTNAVQNVIDDLYYRMNTNTAGNGTTIEDFKTGLEDYVTSKGRDITYESFVSNEHLDLAKYKQAINNKIPVAFFVSKYTLIDLFGISENNKVDQYNLQHYGGDHMLIGYGLREITYYNKDGSVKQKINLLMAATGYSQVPLAYIVIDNTMRIIGGYGIKIY